MEAMLAAANNKKNSGSAPATPDATGQAPNAAAFASGGAAAPGAAPAAAAPAWHPTVSSRQGSTILNLVAEATEIVQTKSKATSLSALAADQVLDQALSLGTQAAQQALMKSGSAMGSSAVSSGTNILGGILGRRPKHAKVTAAAALAPGQYAIALRPIDKSHKFSGEDVGKNQGEGLLFNYAWSFLVK